MYNCTFAFKEQKLILKNTKSITAIKEFDLCSSAEIHVKECKT